jgi:hypothetical protein
MTLEEAESVKNDMGDCDYWTFPKARSAGFTDFKNADGKE